MKHGLFIVIAICVATWTSDKTRPIRCPDGSTEEVTIVKNKKPKKITRRKTCYEKEDKSYTRRFGSRAEANQFFRDCGSACRRVGPIRCEP